MTDQLLNRRNLEFMLYEVLDTGSLPPHSGYQALSRRVFDEFINTAEEVAEKRVGKGAGTGGGAEETRNPVYKSDMTTEVCIDEGIRSAVRACQVYARALAYVREIDPHIPTARLVEDVEVRGRLLALKVHAEGALALCFYAASLKENSALAESDCERHRAAVLCDLLSPVVNSVPSRYGRFCDDLAMQVLTGVGDERECPLVHGFNRVQENAGKIQLLDGYAYDVFKQEVRITLQLAGEAAELHAGIDAIDQALKRLDEIAAPLIKDIRRNTDSGLASATLYLNVFAGIVMAWLWLKQALVAVRALRRNEADEEPAARYFYEGKRHAACYFMAWELPRSLPRIHWPADNDRLCRDMKNEWF